MHEVQRHRYPDGQQVQRIEPEQAADPERPHAALALQRRRHDVPADDEEDEDAVVARVEPVVDLVSHMLEHVVAQVVEHHGQRGNPAQQVQPGQAAAGPSRGVARERGLGGDCGLGGRGFGHCCRLGDITVGHEYVTRTNSAFAYSCSRLRSALGSAAKRHIRGRRRPLRDRATTARSEYLFFSSFSCEDPMTISPNAEHGDRRFAPLRRLLLGSQRSSRAASSTGRAADS